jgi:hypothetical protein
MAVPRLRHERTVRNCHLVESKQLPRVRAADLKSISLGNFGGIEPRASLRVILERIIDGEQHAVGADGQSASLSLPKYPRS